MRGTYGRTYLGGLFICAVATAVAAGASCSPSSTRKPVGTSGTAGTSTTGAAGTTSSTGAAGDSSATGTAGTSAAGTSGTGAAGTSTTGTAGTDATGTAGTAAAGTTGAAGDSSAAGTVGAAGDSGAAGTTAVDNTPTKPLPITVTDTWFPSGYFGDGYTQSLFGSTDPTMIPIKMTVSTTGPCANRVALPVGDCYQVVYNPQVAEGGAAGYAGVTYLTDAGGVLNWTMPLQAPRPAQGATKVSLVIAGAVGGESVTLNVGAGASDGVSGSAMPTVTTSWQPVSIPLTGTYDHVISGFGWVSASATKITFYLDNIVFGQ